MSKRRVFSEEEINEIIADYKAGISTYVIGEKHNTSHTQISKIANRCGLRREKGNRETRKNADAQKRAEGKRLFKEWIASEYGNEFICLEYTNHATPYKLRCSKCGAEFTRWPDKRKKIRCPECWAKELELIRKANNGKRFETSGSRHRCRKYGRIYDPSVTRDKLIERDNNTCQICGGKCDANDRRYGHFGPLTPTIDHITPLAKGGNHVWENVQLAHAVCNIIKNDNDLTDEVISHAKEQAITNKCA